MTAVVADALLCLAVLVALLSCLGLLVMPGVYAKLHYLAPLTLVSPFLVALAITVRVGWRENTVESWLALMILMVAGPFLTHATLRAARVRETGDWRARGEDGG